MSLNQHYWLVSGPYAERSDPSYVLNNIKSTLGNRATCDLFPVPELRVGTLDALMALSDDLVKFDNFIESVTRKIAAQLFTLRDATQNDSQLFSVNGANMDLYLTHFKWDEAKYPVKSSCRDLTEMINSQVSRLDEELRVKSTEYNALSHSISASERNQTGNLISRDITEYVTSDNWLDSEYLTTLLVVVPKYNIKEWESSYESLSDSVVPRSAKVLTEDNEFFLFSIIVFKKKS
jgi:V-type H+-transporting ATPase subunit C